MRILLVEDDIVMAKTINFALSGMRASVDHIDNGQEALDLAKRYDYDVIILDLILPDMEGYDVVRRLRDARVETPVLILSGLARPNAKVRGLTLGADDFLTKPFDASELVARVQSLIRRSRGFSKSKIGVQGLEIDLTNKKVSFNNMDIPLTGKEYDILELLVLRKGMTISKEAFLSHLYGGIDEPEIKIVDVFICKLRKKLKAVGLENMIGTSWGRGYLIRGDRSDRENAMPGDIEMVPSEDEWFETSVDPDIRAANHMPKMVA